MNDWSSAPSENEQRHPTATAFTLIEIRWRARGPSGHVIACGIYGDETAIELRVHFGDGEIVRAQATRNLEEARLRAGEWLDTALEQGGFELLSGSPEDLAS